jgi:antitoxin (DNA-binding transcriptional repressor) of toxin-antitoxin stability system
MNIKLDDAATHLPDLIKAAINGEDVFIVADDKQVVQLVPLARPKLRPQFGSAKGLIVIADDFDEPLEDFSEYM